MDLRDLKKVALQEKLGILPEKYSRILAFIDFGNVNRWYDNETTDSDGNLLKPNESIEIEIGGLYEFLNLITQDSRFYYGFNSAKEASSSFIRAVEYVFGKYRVFKKPIQQIKHYLGENDSVDPTFIRKDVDGSYIYVPKCNFDVEIAVDAMRLIKSYDTICLLSGDSDFAALLRYLKQKGKRTILIKGGRVTHALSAQIDLKIEAHQIKEYITYVKQRPDILMSGSADSSPVSTGRAEGSA
ncbi:MAG: NYN domain-containing protein [bacterium]|nr:NYN domain-containing protein [bacterium]